MATIWKTANGFIIPFSKLTEMPDEKAGVVDKAQLISIRSDDGGHECTPLFSFDARQSFEMYAITQKPGFTAQGEPHPRGTMA